MLNEIRSRTARLHERLDREIPTRELLSSRAGYVLFLQASLVAAEPLEHLLDAEHMPRTICLRADLAELGILSPSPMRASVSAVPLTPSEVFGYEYVLEGSTLGGVVLAKLVEQALPSIPVVTRYLRLRGNDTMQLWRSFVARFEAWGLTANAENRDAACMSAESAFERYLVAFAFILRPAP